MVYYPPATMLTPSGDTSGATDYAALTAALAAGPVTLEPGTFWVNQVLQIPGFSTLVGAGAGAEAPTIKMAAGANLAAVAASSGWTASTNTLSVNPAYIRGIIFDGNSAHQSSGAGHGLVLQTYASYIEDCVFQNTRGDGLRFDYYGANGSTGITGNTAVENRVFFCQARSAGAVGIHVNDPSYDTFTDGFILDCIVANSSAQAISVDSAAGWKIDGNHLYGNGMSALACARPLMTRIANNYMEDWGASASTGTYAAIDLIALFINDGGQGTAITGNTMRLNDAPGSASSTMYGIAVEAATGDIGSVAITGNMITAPDNTDPANYTAVLLACQSSTATLNAMLSGNEYTGNWGGGLVVQSPNSGTINLNEVDSAGALISNGNQPAATIQTSANQAFTTALNVLAPNLSAVTRDVLFNLGVAATARNAASWSFEYIGVGSTSNNMKFNFFGTAVFFSITAGGIVSTLDNTLDNGAGASTFAGLMTLNGGTDTAGSAPILTALGAASGTALQLSDHTRDYMVYLEVTTAGTATSLTMGHTSAASDVTIVSSVAVAAGQLWAFRLPAGWWFKWTGTTTAIGNQVAVGC